MAKDSNVRFVRIHGRIVPIRGGGNGGLSGHSSHEPNWKTHTLGVRKIPITAPQRFKAGFKLGAPVGALLGAIGGFNVGLQNQSPYGSPGSLGRELAHILGHGALGAGAGALAVGTHFGALNTLVGHRHAYLVTANKKKK